MVTHFLSRDEVRAYARDLLKRVRKLQPLPTALCPMTRSGTALLGEMLDLLPELCPELTGAVPVVSLDVNERTKRVRFIPDTPEVLKGRNVFLFDGAIHSGSMMSACVDEILARGAAQVCTYALVMKRSSVFVPTLWSVMLDDTDRAFFLLDEIPNNRLDAGGKSSVLPYAHLRVLAERDVDAPPLRCNVKSLDRATWGDRHFDMQTGNDRRTYLLLAARRIVGYVTVSGFLTRCLHVDELAVDRGQQGRGYGGILLRFADTFARHFDCRSIRLHAIKDKVRFYKKYGYKRVAAAAELRLDKEQYQLMERAVIYHVPE